MGVVLYGYNVTYRSALGFHPWGHCQHDALLIHYMRSPAQMRRYSRRAAAGQDVCGNGFPEGEVCARAAQNKDAEITCPAGTTVSRVTFAAYGRPLPGQEHKLYRWCGEGMEGVLTDSECSVDRTPLVESHCLGKQRCKIAVNTKVFPEDPCPGKAKHFQAVVKCG